MSKKIETNSIIRNPTPIQHGAVTDSIEDRSSYFRSGQPISWDGSTLTFGDDIIFHGLLKKTGGEFTATISAGNVSLSDGEVAYISINRTANSTPSISTVAASSLSAQSSANKDIIILAHRVDSGGIAYLYIPFHKQTLEPGQSALLGASGSGDGEGQIPLPADGFVELIYDKLDTLPTDAESTISDTETNAEYSAANTLYKLLCDKAPTITTTGTSFSLSAVPSFTIAIGDIIYDNISGEFRKIIALSDQQNGTLDVAFTIDLSANTGMISQCVWSSNLVIFGDSLEKTRILDSYPSIEVTVINISYEDSLIDGDATPDFIDEARVAVSASNISGVTPTTDTYAPIYKRPQAPNQILNYSLLDNAPKNGLNLAFFCNPDNSNVISSANLLQYEVSLVEEETLNNGGYLSSAYCRTDGSVTAVNCSQPTVVGGVTEIELDFNYVPGINPGDPRGDLDVIIDGKAIPREVSGSTSVHWSEVAGSTNKIQLWDDLSAFSLSIEVIRRQGSIDTSDTNTTRLNTLEQTVQPAQNHLLNGDFEIWQRNTTSALSSQAYVADRWRSNSNGTASTTFSRQTLSGVNIPSQYAMRMLRTAGTDLWDITQGLISRDFLPLRGKTITFSVYLRKGADLTSDVNLRIDTTDIEAIAGAIVEETTTLNIPNASISSANFTKFDVSLTIPANTAATAMRVVVQVESQVGNTNAYLEVAQAMLNTGAEAAGFKRAGKSFEDELQMCQVFYEKSYDLSTVPGTVTSNGAILQIRGAGTANMSFSYKVRKRSAGHSVAAYNPITGALDGIYNNNTLANELATYPDVGEYGVVVNTAAATSGDTMAFHIVADAEL